MSYYKIIGAMLALSLSASAANANIIISFGSDDVCTSATGVWVGSGNVSAVGLKCKYNGTSIVSATPNATVYNMDIKLYKTSGLFCPDQQSLNFLATCENGVIVIKEDSANLNGTTDGKTAHLSGTVSIPVNGVPVKANVDMNLTKQ